MAQTVLIVDDHPSFRATARALLEAEGFLVVGEAANGAEALAEAESLHPDVVLQRRSNQAICDRLFITERAVEQHVTSIFGKLRLPADAGDHRRVLAVLAYLRR